VRRLKVAGVATGLGALTALTVGLAAPAIAAGLGAFGIAGMSGAGKGFNNESRTTKMCTL
jgi:Zn-dependent alcohol dehydrogenase